MVYLDTTRDILPKDGFSVPELSRMGFTSDDVPPAYQPHAHVPKDFLGTRVMDFRQLEALGLPALTEPSFL